MTTKTLTSLVLITATFGCADTDKSSDTDEASASPTTEAAAEEDANRLIDGAVLLKDGTERPLVSGLAYLRDDFGEEQFVVVLSTYELDDCDVQYWWEQSGDDWNLVEIAFSEESGSEVMVCQPFVLEGEDGGDGAECSSPRRPDVEIDADPLSDFSIGQEISGTVMTGSENWGGSMNSAKAKIESIDADFTVKFCGQLEEH